MMHHLLLTMAFCSLAADSYEDIQLLKKRGVAADPPSLLKYFRQRTLDETALKKIPELIGQLSDKNYARRTQASKDLEALGVPALRLLEKFLAAPPDLETGRRVQLCVATLRQQLAPEAGSAALRLLKRSAPPQAAAVL